ncbi:MAG: sulfotransferase [Dongiaceae bacterium]
MGSTVSNKGHGTEPVGTSGPWLVCMLGVGRVGSNHLTRSLGSVPEIDSRAEIFNKARSYALTRPELKELSRRLGKRFKPSNRNPKALRAIKRRPGLVLDCIAALRQPQKRIVSFKVIFSQLTAGLIARQIIGRPDTIIVFLRRRPVEVYISQMKAWRLQEWHSVDTTDLKIQVDADEFLKWRRARDIWYRRLEAACWYRNKPFQHLTYEDDIDRRQSEAIYRFCALLEPYGLTGFTMPDDAKIKGLFRQDRNEDIADRVANWPDFQRRLETMGCLDKAFEPFQRFQPNAWDHVLRGLFGLGRAIHRLLFSRSDRTVRAAMPDESAPALGSGRNS